MTKDQLWALNIKHHPSFETKGANFTAEGLRKFFDTTWDVCDNEMKKQKGGDPMPDFLRDLMNGKIR